MTRPVTTTVAPPRRHSAMPNAPRYALAVSAPGTSTASPSTCPTWTVRPSLSARSRSASASPAGFSPPALVTMRDAPVHRDAQALLQLAQERPRVAEGRVAQPVAAEDQHGQLGQVVAGEHVQLAAGEHLRPRVEPVAVEAGRVADPQRPGHERAPLGWLAAAAGRAGEGLRDVEPGVGDRTGGGQGEVAAVRAAGSPAGRSRAPARRPGLSASAGPNVHSEPSGAGQLEPDRLDRGRLAVGQERVPDACGGPGARCGAAGRSAARMTPSASAMSCPWAQVSISRAVASDGAAIAVPYQAILAPGGTAASAVGSAGPAGPPACQHRRRLVEVLLGAAVDETVRVGQRPVEVGGERVRVGDGQVGRGVGPGQVADLVRDRPAGGRRRAWPSPTAGRSATRASTSADSAARSASSSAMSTMDGLPLELVHELASSSRRAARRGAAASSVSRLATPRPAQQVERRLHGLPYARAGLVRAEQRDRDPVHLAARSGPPAARARPAAPDRCGRRPRARARPRRAVR